MREGINLAVGQSVNLALSLKVSAVQEEVLVSGDAPVVETTRAEGATRIDSDFDPRAPEQRPELPRLHEADPRRQHRAGPRRRRADDQRPEGDPEQRLGGRRGFQQPVLRRAARRPAAGVHVQPRRRQGGRGGRRGRQRRVRPEQRRLRQRRHQVGGQRRSTGRSTRSTRTRTSPRPPRTPTAPRPRSSTSTRRRPASPWAARSRRTSSSTSWPSTTRTGLDQADRSRRGSIRALVSYFSSLGSPNENGAIDRTNDARVFLGKLDWQINSKHLATIRYNYTWSEQKNGTFDVDSWGRSANATEKDYSHAVTGSLISNLSATTLNEFRFQWAREYRPRPYDGPLITGESRPLPDTAMDFAQRVPLRRAVLHPGRLLRRARPVQREPLDHQGAPQLQGGCRVQPRPLQPDLPRLPERPLRLRLDRRLPELHEEPEVRRVQRRQLRPRRVSAPRGPRSPARCFCSSSRSVSTA